MSTLAERLAKLPPVRRRKVERRYREMRAGESPPANPRPGSGRTAQARRRKRK